MARSKNSTKSAKGTDGKRKETKEERKERLRKQAEAREQCFKTLPYAGGVVVVLMIVFALWVRTVPPKAPSSPVVKIQNVDNNMGQSRPEDDPMLQAALRDAQEALQQAAKENADAEKAEESGETADTASAAAGETIEL